MATKSQSSEVSEPVAQKVIKMCTCGATVFQGPFPVGPIVNGVMAPNYEEYRCVRCNKPDQLDKIGDHAVEQPAPIG